MNQIVKLWPRASRLAPAAFFGGLVLFSSSCMVGPKYQRPPAPVTPAFKEPLPEGWKEARPNDGALKGKWWELYKDPDLNALEEQVSISNQNVLVAEAQFREARASIRIARAGLFPTVTASPTITSGQSSQALGFGAAGTVGAVTSVGNQIRTTFDMPFDVSYQIDLWGSIRRNIRASAETAQADQAQLENIRLLYQSELAQDFFGLHGADADEDLLERTVKSYEEYLQLTRDRYASGVASGGDVAQAETQLYTTSAELVDLGTTRQTFEHAIAVLMGKPPAELRIPSKIIKAPPPIVPIAVPSVLLERRPDIAAAERQMASVNEQIGIAQAAFYPSVTLSGSVGLQAASFLNWFTWPARFWSAGPGATQILYDAGRRRAQVHLEEAAFDAAVANYRQTVLTAFQQVEDNLASLRILAQEADVQARAVEAADRSLEIATAQYKAGTTSYLQVITTQAIALQNERSELDILTRRNTASVMLIQALGGGWDTSQLPSIKSVMASGN